MKRPRPNRLMHAGYANLLRGLIEEPATWHRVAERNGISDNIARRTLRRMHDMRLIHVGGWLPTRGPATPIFAFGDLTDVPRPLNRSNGLTYSGPGTIARAKPQPELVAFASMVRALIVQPHTHTELAEATGVHINTARRFIRHLVSIGLAHVACWDRRMHGGCPAAAYQFAVDRPNAPRPRPEPRSQIEARYRAARKQRSSQLKALRAIACNSSPFTAPRPLRPHPMDLALTRNLERGRELDAEKRAAKNHHQQAEACAT